ncbi:MAG: patatin-like phospholipase family protein [Pseudomonadales bacterium]|nr:patatin-like phospholipase family protein [Pseudomonadales bacterium]MBO6564837.1 patatin-like phospholipase family protein [Pseudomonadales bacterium]MBO6596865.1 patatin-like phospholipase family protein [Pseudomonadales bacterium]MBO6703536.1 patatin-like phospholipase family protein [Pseudomonadales bacterium]MBO6823146.1 patatin-like phospholipase family protein [Pseudomonadales bacterium]
MSRWLTGKLLFLTLVASCHTLADRPKIGLVLSGGGARGAAHIGVLKALEEHRIPIDYIAGTSMGSIVGGLYASGLNAHDIEQVLVTMDWNEKLSDAPSRTDKSIIRKVTESQFSVSGRPGFNNGIVELPQGLIQGQKILPELQQLTNHVSHIQNFADLPIPFRAVATDIVAGDMIIMETGDLAVAMRASMAVPSVFAPTSLDDLLLVDGGLTNNLPVDVVKAMGADIVIAVDISSPLLDKSKVKSILEITDQLTRILTGVNTQERRGMLSEHDILIEPPIGEYSAGNFNDAQTIIPVGEEEALKHLADLQKLALTPDEYERHVELRLRETPAAPTITQVALSNDSGLDDKVLEQWIKTSKGEQLDLERLEQDINDVHALGNFQSVSYSLDHTADGVDINLDAAAKSWGPNYLYLGLDMEGDLAGDSLINLSVGYSREEMTDKGAMWTSWATVGDEPGVQTHLYLPLSYSLGPYAMITGGFTRNDQAIYNEDDKLADYRLLDTFIAAGIGWEFSRQSAMTIGFDRIEGEAKLLVGNQDNPEPEYSDGGLWMQYRYDSLDERDFPASGTYLNVRARKSFESMGADSQYERYELGLAHVIPYKTHRFVLGLQAGTTEGDSTIAGLFTAGGGPTLLGLKRNQLIGPHLAVVQAYYYKEYAPMPFLSGYIGGLLEYGGIYAEQGDMLGNEDSITSGSLWFGMDTPVGPFQIGVGTTDEGEFNVFTRVGHLF